MSDGILDPINCVPLDFDAEQPMLRENAGAIPSKSDTFAHLKLLNELRDTGVMTEGKFGAREAEILAAQ